MATQWPLVVNRLLELLPALDGWSAVSVFDGPPITGDVPVDYATVGYTTSSPADDTAGAYTLVQDPDGFQWQESGHIRSQLTCVSGDTDLSAMRIRMFGLLDAIEASVRADRTLGAVLSPQGTSELAVDVLSVQNAQGTAQAVDFTLHYFTVT